MVVDSSTSYLIQVSDWKEIPEVGGDMLGGPDLMLLVFLFADSFTAEGKVTTEATVDDITVDNSQSFKFELKDKEEE